MKNKILKMAAASLLLATVGVFSGCDGALEMPEWLEQELCDHVYDEEEILEEATCTEDGRVMKICSDCGKTKIVVVPGRHTVEEIAEIPATCTTSGMTAGEVCSVCDEVLLEAEEIPALGHAYGEWTGDTGSVHTYGSKERTCSACGFVDVQLVLCSNSSYEYFGEEYVLIQETCVSNGYIARDCDKCYEIAITHEIPSVSITGTSHVGEISEDGICSACNSKDFTAATFAEVKEGDVLTEGWYRFDFSQIPFTKSHTIKWDRGISFEVSIADAILSDDEYQGTQNTANFTIYPYAKGTEDPGCQFEYFKFTNGETIKEQYLSSLFDSSQIYVQPDYIYVYINNGMIFNAYYYDGSNNVMSEDISVSNVKFASCNAIVERVLFTESEDSIVEADEFNTTSDFGDWTE